MKRYTVFFSLVLAACGTDAPQTQDVAPDAVAEDVAVVSDSQPADAAPLDMTPPADVAVAEDIQPDTGPTATSFQLDLGTWSMPPGQETTKCVVKRLGNASKVLIDRIQTTLGRGSHHFIVYRSPDTVEKTTPFTCAPFSQTLGGSTVPLMISQTRQETLELPDGVAFELEANQMIRLEAHYLNYFPEVIDTSATVTFNVAPTTDTVLADFMFYGNTNVYIPAGQAVTTPWKYYSVPSGAKVFGLTGHTHALGTNVEIQRSSNQSTAGQGVYPPSDAPFEWAEAPVAQFSPPLEFGGDGFRFRCSWMNTTAQDVSFGESATQEMCFFWAYYYPSQGFILKF